MMIGEKGEGAVEHEPLALEDLTAIEARANAASAGPWRSTYAAEGVVTRDAPESLPMSLPVAIAVADPTIARRTDADFIAHAREDVPRLLATARRLYEDNATLSARLRAMVDTDTGSPKVRIGPGPAGEFSTTLGKHWAIELMAASLHESFVESGAVNYLETQLLPGASQTPYLVVVTIQRGDRLTPHQLRVKAERERDDARSELAALRAGIGLVGSSDDAAPGPEAPRLTHATEDLVPLTTKRTDMPWVMLNYRAWPRRFECAHCGDTQDLPTMFSPGVFQSMLDAYAAQHGRCAER